MNYRAGFIGAGNMGGILALSAAKCCGNEKVAILCSSRGRTEKRAKKLGVTGADIESVCAADYVFLAIKPQKLAEMSETLRPLLEGKKNVLVSMLAGVSIETLKDTLHADKIIRIMPNTPAAVGEGMTLVCASDAVSEEEMQGFSLLIASAGRSDVLSEKLFDAASALSGCGPAYMFLLLEALSDGAVKCGLPRDKALTYAAQTMLGSASLFLSGNEHPGKLKDAVCSPGGSTIAGVAALEKGGFRACAMDAVESAYLRTRELGKN